MSFLIEALRPCARVSWSRQIRFILVYIHSWFLVEAARLVLSLLSILFARVFSTAGGLFLDGPHKAPSIEVEPLPRGVNEL